MIKLVANYVGNFTPSEWKEREEAKTDFLSCTANEGTTKEELKQLLLDNLEQRACINNAIAGPKNEFFLKMFEKTATLQISYNNELPQLSKVGEHTRSYFTVRAYFPTQG